MAMSSIHPFIPYIWGGVALGTIIVGLTFLLFNMPPAGKVSGLIGFMLWVFAGFCWIFSGGWILIFAIAIPNLWFWFWQYFSLSSLRREDKEDRQTMMDYDDGGYDDEINPKDSKIDRECNRGQDIQN